MLLRIVKITAIVVVLLIAAFVGFIGPWPVIQDTEYETQAYFQRDLEAIAREADEEVLAEDAQGLRAGWASVDMTPQIGVPLAGYGARQGDKRSTGVNKPLYVRTLAFSDGADTVVLLGSDMLIVPPNVAEIVRDRCEQELGLDAGALYLTASHSHCGPGGLAPGMAMEMSAGPYDPEVPPFIADRMVEAVRKAMDNLAPAKYLPGGVDGSEYIKNREVNDTPGRENVVDAEISYCLVENSQGERCFLVSFSAHPTVYGADMMEFDPEFPGAFVETLVSEGDAEAVYLGGATGSMGPSAPQATTVERRVELMGRGLAEKVLEDVAQQSIGEEAAWVESADVASIGLPITMPAAQVRPASASWRLSPMVANLVGVPTDGWISAARVGDLFFFGTPFDCSGEMAVRWKNWAEGQGLDLWVTGFNGAYLGYLSPDEYFNLEPLGYETGLMSWFGPDLSAHFTDLLEQSVQELTPEAA